LQGCSSNQIDAAALALECLPIAPLCLVKIPIAGAIVITEKTKKYIEHYNELKDKYEGELKDRKYHGQDIFT